MTDLTTQLAVMTPNGRADLAHVMGFEVKQTTRTLTINRIDGTKMTADLPTDWSGRFKLDRPHPDFREKVEGEDRRILLYHYVPTSYGSVATYLYDGAVFAFADDLTVDFSATTRRRI